MRLHVASYNEAAKRFFRQEVIGELVVLEKYPDEQFAVHANPFATERNREPYYCVTHVGTGFRFAGGDSPNFAIQITFQKMEEKTPEQFSEALRSAHDALRSQLVQPANGGAD